MITELHHVNVTVPSELELETKNFYRFVLGLPELPKPEGTRKSGAWYQMGAAQLHLSIEDGAVRQLSSRHICLTVKDLDAAEKRFSGAGVEIIADERPMPDTRRFYVRDPGGNQFEIVERD
jgi:catechol 2,3-dioxygenase-like lactoylglutathione lyase family enzyme